MPKFKVLKSFAGPTMGRKGSIIDVNDKEVEKDLLKAGYIQPIKEEVKRTPRKRQTTTKQN